MYLSAQNLAFLVALPLAIVAAPAFAGDDGRSEQGSRAAVAPIGGVAVQTALPNARIPLIADPKSAAKLGRVLADANITLPAGGVEEACAGFPTLFRCVAALHLSKNIKVGGGFTPVREMLLYDSEASIADAARAFAPEVDPIAAERTAQGQAMDDLRKAGLVR